MIIFQNEGSLDPRLITTLGVNVKEAGSNPIGYFGTGLKYAIAVLLREGQIPVIYSNGCEYHFHLEGATIRGKEFQFLCMDTFDGVNTTSQELGFTTEFGKNWQIWQAYRELYCNTIDEKGQIIRDEKDNRPDVFEDTTVISVQGEAFDKSHLSRNEFILSHNLRHIHTNGMEIHEGKAIKIFCKGIAVFDLPRPTMFHYNNTKPDGATWISLTEDRTLAGGGYDAQRLIAAALLTCEDRGILEKALLCGDSFLEYHCDYSWPGIKAGDLFLTVCKEHYLDKRLSKTALELFKSIEESSKEAPPIVEITDVQKRMLEKACKFVRSIGYPGVWAKDQNIVENLGKGILGRVIERKAYISLLSFEQGTKRLAGTILEEHIHITKGFMDYTHEFQDYLIDRLMSMGEELMGEPL